MSVNNYKMFSTKLTFQTNKPFTCLDIEKKTVCCLLTVKPVYNDHSRVHEFMATVGKRLLFIGSFMS